MQILIKILHNFQFTKLSLNSTNKRKVAEVIIALSLYQKTASLHRILKSETLQAASSQSQDHLPWCLPKVKIKLEIRKYQIRLSIKHELKIFLVPG